MKIYLTRHGETLWNTQFRFQGGKDSPLTENGIRAAKDLGKAMTDISLDRIYVSPLLRAQRTADFIKGERQIPMVTDSRLTEMFMGDWEGRSIEEVKREQGDKFRQYWEDMVHFQLPGGESFQNVYDRCKSFVQDLKKEEPGHYLVVSHGMTLAFLFEILRGATFETINAPVHIVKGATLSLFSLNNQGQFQEEFFECAPGYLV